MTAQRLSPTAKLLRSSRLFSLPPPLPKPSHDITATSLRTSDTATLPHPSYAAIETTQSSLSRGDWGLKRPLPQRSTAATSTPIIRVSAVDSIDHITNFDSAADHALTLRKWQEMNIPISMPYAPHVASASTSLAPTSSVFEPHLDSTDTNNRSGITNSSRWKFKGPWLAGKTEGEFQAYVKGEIKRRRPEFRQFLRKCLQNKNAATMRRAAIDRGDDLQSNSIQISDRELEVAIKELRQGDNWVELEGYIRQFLDLPGVNARNTPQGSAIHEVTTRYNSAIQSEQGPPKTHRSAGLSYLRSSSHVPNHPILGPLSAQQPVKGRVLQAATQGMKQTRVTVGVGGITAVEVPSYDPLLDNKTSGWSSFDPDIEGGAKAWVHPQQASIDSQGRIKLHIRPANKNTLAVWEGEIEGQPLSDVVRGINRSVPDLIEDSSKPQAGKFSSGSRSLSGRNRGFLNREDSTEHSQTALNDLLKSQQGSLRN
ncbi:hypothetical protein MMC24_001538 [Lignoscripta atroalba]|nr:hypothetical protein [Lignoscripta atroalba]